MVYDRLNQASLWFSVDKIIGAINRIRQQRAFGIAIEDGHLAELDEMARRITTISNRYDSVPRTGMETLYKPMEVESQASRRYRFYRIRARLNSYSKGRMG